MSMNTRDNLSRDMNDEASREGFEVVEREGQAVSKPANDVKDQVTAKVKESHWLDRLEKISKCASATSNIACQAVWVVLCLYVVCCVLGLHWWSSSLSVPVRVNGPDGRLWYSIVTGKRHHLKDNQPALIIFSKHVPRLRRAIQLWDRVWNEEFHHYPTDTMTDRQLAEYHNVGQPFCDVPKMLHFLEALHKMQERDKEWLDMDREDTWVLEVQDFDDARNLSWARPDAMDRLKLGVFRTDLGWNIEMDGEHWPQYHAQVVQPWRAREAAEVAERRKHAGPSKPTLCNGTFGMPGPSG